MPTNNEVLSGFLARESKLSKFYEKGIGLQILAEGDGFTVRFPSAKHSYDSPAVYSLANFASKIGVTGHNFLIRKALRVNFEFDAQDHEGGLTDAQLAEVLAALKGRCAIHTSTHGKGYHCRLELDKPVAMSGHEYTTYSNQCIAQLGEEVGLDLPNLICGKNILWIWSKSQTSDSFSLISEQTIPFSCDFSNSTPKMWESPTKISVKPDIHGIAKACGERPTLKELREIVLALRGDYLNKRANWFRVLCVIKRLGDYDLADEYSKLSNCYDPVELLTTWDSITKSETPVLYKTICSWVEKPETYPLPVEVLPSDFVRMAFTLGGPDHETQINIDPTGLEPG